MPDGQFSIPNIKIPNLNSNPETPISYRNDSPLGNQVYFSPTSYNVNPALYDLDKVALQSGLTNWVNSFIQGLNQTQISASQYGLFQNQKRIAEIEDGLSYKGKLSQLESEFLSKSIDEIDYLQQKNQLLGELNTLYSDNMGIRNSIASDEADIENAPVSKSFQTRQQLLQGLGAEAGFLDQIAYNLPSVAGSSAATLGATIVAGFGSDFIKKVASRVAASATTGPAAGFVAAGATIASLGSLLYYARDLESQAEVGGAIAEDLDRLTQDYLLSTGKQQEELTAEEQNELMTKAYQGSEQQYWKNMSLAAVDALQSVLLAGNVGKWFERVSNLNKFSRLGATAGSLYLQSKGEALEEGLQYAFQKEKNNAAGDPNYVGNNSAYFNGLDGFLSTVVDKNFINSIRQDYADVLSSMNYGPIKGDGKYSEDKEFQFSTDAGFLMGLFTGGGAGVYRTAKDLVSYKQAASELQKAGVENAEGNAFKFNTALYKSFFQPSKGIFGSESSDRVHYLREGIKALGKKKDQNGEVILTQQEVQNELANIGEAYRTYDNLNKYVDNIFAPFNKDQKAITNLAKAKFRDATFTQAMQDVFNKKNLNNARSAQTSAMVGIDPQYAILVNLNSQLETVNNRISQIKNLEVGEAVRENKVSYLNNKAKQLKDLIKEQETSLKDAGISLNNQPPAPPSLVSANSDLLTAEMFADESTEKYKKLLKIRSRQNLIDWFRNTAEEELNAGLSASFSAIQQTNQEDYKRILDSRKQYDLLDIEEERERQAENKRILKDAGFTTSEINGLNYEELERRANEILNTFASGGVYVNENLQYRVLAQVTNQGQFSRLFDNPSTSQFLTNNFPGVSRDSNFTTYVEQAKAYLQAQQDTQVKKPLEPTPTGSYTSIGRNRMPGDVRRVEDFVDMLGLPDSIGQLDQATVLNNIINSSYSTASERALARELLKVTEEDDVIEFAQLGSAGAFDADNNTIAIDLRFVSSDYNGIAPFETVVLHELLHKYTVNTLEENPDSELNNRLKSLYNFVLDQARTKNVFDKFYGLKNEYEFITEAMTNPEFQEFLKGLAYKTTKRTVWEEFLNLINATLRSLGITSNQTALDEIVSVTSGLVELSNREAFTSIRARFEPKIAETINSKKTFDENKVAARELYKELYDLNLSSAEFDILKAAIDERLSTVNDQSKAKDVYKFGKWNIQKGNFIVPVGKNYVYTTVSQNKDNSLIVSYEFVNRETNKKQTASRTINDPSEIAEVFSEAGAAFDFIKGRTPVKTEQAPQPGVDGFGDALTNFINYTNNTQQYGTLDPKLIELGNELIKAAVKIGRTNFSDISSEIIGRVGEDTYKKIFANLRQVYTALYADYSKQLTDNEGDMLNLVMGRTTADSMLNLLNQKIEPSTNKYTGGTATPAEEVKLSIQNIRDRISGELYKSTGQQFKVDANNNWTREIDDDPVKVRYYKLLERLIESNTSPKQAGYYGLLVQDGDTLPDGTPIPKERNTINYIEAQKKAGKKVVYGQIAIIVSADGTPLKFNQNGELDGNGELITFNIESAKTAQEKPVGIVARVTGLPEEQAKLKVEQSSKNIEAIRNSAKSGKPVLLELSTKTGVPIFSETVTTTQPLLGKNVEIEVATIQKDSTNLGYFERHPNQTGFLGGAYIFLNNDPIKIEPTGLTEEAANLVLAILDQQTNGKISADEVKSRSKFLKDLVYQKYSKDATEGTLYFSGSDLYFNGAKVPKDNRKQVLLTNARFNIVSNYLNKNWRPYKLVNGSIKRSDSEIYNDHVLTHGVSRARFTNTGNQVSANSYFTYKIAKQITDWLTTPTQVTEEAPKNFTSEYKAKNLQTAKTVSASALLSEMNLDENIGAIEPFIESARELKLLRLTIDDDGSRTALVFVDKGDSPNSGSTEVKLFLRKLPAKVSESTETDKKSEPSSAKASILSKLKNQNLQDQAKAKSIDDNVKSDMDSIAKPRKFYYGKVESSIGSLGATKSQVVVRSIDRIIYDFINSYDRSIVETLAQPKILTAAYKFAYSVFKNNTIDLRNEYIARIEAAPEEALEGLVAELDSKLNKFNEVTSKWNEVVEYHKEHSKTFIIQSDQIKFAFDESGNILEENTDEDPNKAKNSFDGNSGNEVSSIDGANKETKTLIRGLGKAKYVNGVVTPSYNEFGVQELVDFASTWNNLALTLQGTMEFDKMLQKIESVVPAFPEYNELLGILSKRDNMSISDISQISKFRQDFSRSYVGIYELVFNPEEQSYKFLEATKSNITAILDQFTDNFTSSPKSEYIAVDAYGNNYLTDSVLNIPVENLQDRLKFLGVLGVKFTPGSESDPEFTNVVSGRTIAVLKNSLKKLLDAGIKITTPLQQLSAPNKDLELKGEAGNINKLLRIESKYTRNNTTASMQNAAGDAVYALALNNLLTISSSYLSDYINYPTYDDVVGLPHMKHLDFRNNPYVKNSIWLNQMFNLDESSPEFGNRKLVNGQPATISIINYNGLKVEQEEGASEGSTTTSLWIGDKVVQDLNTTLLAGVKEMMRAGDKASAFAVKISAYSQVQGREDKLPVKIEDFQAGYGSVGSLSIISGYLNDELTRMRLARIEGMGNNLDYYKGTAKEFNLFRDIFSAELKEAISKDLDSELSIDVIVSKYQKDLANSLRTFFNKEVNTKVNTLSNYGFSIQDPVWIDKTLRDTYDVGQLLRAYIVNAFIINVEQTKVFNGDGAFYKAFHKRNSKDGSTGTTMMTDTWFLDWLNVDQNTNLQAKALGLNNPVSNVTNSVVFEDNKVASVYVDTYRTQLGELGLEESKINDIVSKYEDANEGDAQGWVTLDFYRTFKLAQGKWYPEHETAYQKASRGELLTQEELFFFMPIKAQYAGPLDYEGAFAPAFHKFSLVPLIPTVIKGTKLESLNQKMIKNNVGYGLFESGSKVATILDLNGKKDRFYSDYKERLAVDPDTPFATLNPIFNQYLKEQVNIEPALHDEVIFGTQFRKLLFQNLFNEGKALDSKWDKLYTEYGHVIDQLVKNEKQRLLEELGIDETSDGVYKQEDFTKLVDKLLKEARRRDMNVNVLSYIEYDQSKNDFKYPLDASVNRQQVQNMIMSIINNRLVRQHVNGDLMVQVSGAGFENYQKPTDVELEQYGTNGLRFYHMKDGKTQSMQVKVPLNGDFVNLLYYTHPDGQRIETLARLNEALKTPEWVEENRKSITMIGYRIPTQGLNSIEFMEVAEFLPSESGNILILPTEIVIKAGSDFDIDKLSIFKPSLRVRYRSNTQGDRVVEKAYYAAPKDVDLSKSIDKQKEELKNKYDPKILELRNKVTKIRDDKTLNVKWLVDQKRKLRELLGNDIGQANERFFDLQHSLRELNYNIIFKSGEVEQLSKELSISGLNPESADLLLGVKLELQDLILERNLVRTELDDARAARNSAFATKSALMEQADDLIKEYLDAFYIDVFEPQKELDELLTDYFNQLEELRAFKKGLQNRIIEIGREVLEDKVNFIQLITPNDTGLIKPMITDAGGIKQKNGYPLKTDYTGTAIYTEKTQEEKFLAGLVGKKALGIAAVNNTFTQLFEIIGLKINDSYNEQIGDQFIRHKVLMPLLKTPKQDSFDFSNVVDEEGVLKSEFISQMVNAYVDVLNDDFIFYANAGLDVAPVLFYLKNAGVPTNKLFYFINHPVIKFYTNQIQKTKSHILKAVYPETYNSKLLIADRKPTFKSVLTKSLLGYKPREKAENVRISNQVTASENPQFFTTDHLFSSISKNLSQISYDERRAILGYFLAAQNQANMLRKFQAGNSYDTSTAATPVDSKRYSLLQDEVLDSKFINKTYQEKIGNTVIKPFNVSEFVKDMFDSLMPITLNDKIVTYLTSRIKDLEIDEQERYSRAFVNDLMLYIFENYVTLNDVEGNPSAYNYIFGGEGRNSMFRFTDSFVNGKRVKIDDRLARRAMTIKTNPVFDNLRAEYPIINQIRIVSTDRSDGFANITINRGENTTDTQNSLIEQFTKLANFNNPAYSPKQIEFVRKFFKDLALFGFAQSGLNKSPISFTDIIPNDLYTPYIVQGIEKYLEDVNAKGLDVILKDYTYRFDSNNGGVLDGMSSYKYKDYHSQFVLTPPSETLKNGDNLTMDEEESNPQLFEYGNLAIQPENRILDSRNSIENQEINEVLQQFTEQSKPCNS